MTNYALYDLIDVLVYDIKNDPSLTSDLKAGCSWVLYELYCLDLYMVCCEKWNSSPFGDENSRKFGFSVRSQMEEALVHTISKKKWSERDFFELVEKIHQCEPEIVRDCLYFLDTASICQVSVGGFQNLWFHISASLDNLFIFRADMILDAKPKIQSLRDNLDFFKAVSEFTRNRCGTSKDSRDVKILIEDSACRTLCVSLICWAMNNKKKETLAPRLDIILSDLQKKTSPSTPEVTRMYLAALEATKTSGEDSIIAGKLVLKLVELLKKNLEVNTEKNDIQMLFTDFIFLITFLMDKEVAGNFSAETTILTEATALVNEVGSLIGLFSFDEVKEGITEQRNFLLRTFLEKANTFKAKVRKLYAHSFPDSSSCNFPRVNVLGVIDSLLLKLKKLHSCFPKHQIMMLQEEILSLKESNFEYLCVLELQNKHKDLENLWTRIVNVAYNAERAISSFVFLKDCLWHNILCLSDAIEETNVIKAEMERIQDQRKFGVDTFNYKMSPNHLLPLQGNVSTNIVVGFEDEENEIQYRLISGSKELHIITIFGMPGSGKTTLAKKVFGDSSIQLHFHKWAWCTVSQTVQQKRIFLDILSDLVDGDNRNLSNLEEEDLAATVFRSLKGRRYFIVMDDIWDVKAWNSLKMSFPDDNMGSRIIFTTRIQNLIPEAEVLEKKQFSPLHLNPLSEEESWELLEKKLFDQEKCLPDFVDIGKQIARNCKGLPLYIVIIAGLLKEKIENLDWWNQVGRSLDMLITKEGCKDVLELSYKHLPEFLKPCFLYFGLFQEDEVIKAKKLIWLWIAEGFIQKQGIKSLEVVAEEYLMDLITRSLVIVTTTTSGGRIKTCVVHDLLREFCIMKGGEEKLVKLVSGENQDRDLATTHAHYRVHIQSRSWEFSFEHPPFVSSIHSLFYPGRYKFSAEHVQSLAFSYFKFLQVMDLNLSVSKFPETLVLLRYLAFDYASMNIPPSIKGLQNLETLCIYRTSPALPTTLWELKRLRHVSGPVQIPTGFWACDIAPLENVQTFSARVYYQDAEMFFRTIPTVRKLKCKFLFSFDQSPHQVIKLDNLSHLESLHMDNHECASVGLYSCTFYSFPSTLKELSLSGFQLPWSDISPIAELQNLEVLKLEDGFRGQTWDVRDEEFPSLKCLVLRDLCIVELNASDDSFPRLERLVIERCYKFKEIPSRFGSILTLKMIQVKDCPYSLNSSVRQIQEELVDLGNEDLKIIMVERKPHTWEPSHFKYFNLLECATYDP